MSVYEALSDEECYLAALFDDPSGIDLAEFCFRDETPGKSDPCYRVRDYQWCLRGDTIMYTSEGRRDIRDAVGPVRLLTEGSGERGVWVDAEVRSFGVDRIWRIVLERRGVRREIHATARHRWFAGPGKADKRRYAEVETSDLQPESYLRPTLAPRVELIMERHAIQAGIVHGDGTVYGGKSRVLLHGDKRELGRWMDGSGSVPPSSPDALYFGSMPEKFKTYMPEVGLADESVLWGWLAGYFATDGSILPDGTCVISSISAASIARVRDVATALGVVCSAIGHRHVDTILPNGLPHSLEEYRVVLRMQDLPLEFFLHPGHHSRRRSFLGRPERREAAWRVVSVEDTGEDEEVFCALVDGTHSFVLDGDILTGNSWYRHDETYQIDQAGRSLGKSEGIVMRAFAFPFNYPGQEMLITAPELNHLDPIVTKVEAKFIHGPKFARAMLPAHKGGGIKHQPQFQASFVNGAVMMGRLPNRDGRGVKGQHPLVLEADEMQDYPKQGWIELIETMKSGVPGAQWRCHGVSRGVRDMYYRMTSEEADIPFYVHRFMGMHRPTWDDEERRNKIAIYGGSRDNPDYKRNIYGEHGDVSNAVFVLARLMACVRQNESTWATEYNESVYNLIKIEGESLESRPIESMVTFPQNHLHQSYTSYWAGMDLGFTNDPSELLVFGQIRVMLAGQPLDVLRLLTRLHLMRVSAKDQETVIERTLGFYGPRLRALSMDKTGIGFPVWQSMDGKPHVRERIRGYGFSEKRAVDFDDRELVGREKPEDAMIEKNVISFATGKLRQYVDSKMMELPYDAELLTEFQGQTVMYSRDEGSSTGSRTRYGGGSFHTLDAAKLMMLGKELEAIEAMQRDRNKRAPVLESFGF